jgi:hypothetical protein
MSVISMRRFFIRAREKPLRIVRSRARVSVHVFGLMF